MSNRNVLPIDFDEFYRDEINKKINGIIRLVNSITRSQTIIYKLLKKHEETIKIKTNLSIEELIDIICKNDSNSERVIKTLEHAILLLRAWSVRLIELNDKKDSYMKMVRDTNNNQLSESILRETVKELNQRLIERLSEAGNLKLGYNLGSIHIAGIKNKNYKIVDWNESNKFKKQLIESGKVPACAAKGIKGEQWIIKRDEPIIFYIRWAKNFSGTIKNASLFKFHPTDYIANVDKDLKYNKINKLHYSDLLLLLDKDKLRTLHCGLVQKVYLARKITPSLTQNYKLHDN